MIYRHGDLWGVAPQFSQRLERELQQPEPDRATIPTARQQGLFDEDRATFITQLPPAGVAVVTITGMIHRDSYWQANWKALAADLRLLDARQSITSVVLDVDSTGGFEMGCREFCDVLDSMTKPVVGFVSGYAMSASYRFLCHCSAIYATASANVGSIGTMINLVDSSRQYQQEGLEVVSASTGPFKAIGVDGLAITSEQRQFLQQRCDRMQLGFADSLRRRGFTGQRLAEVSDGRYWDAAEALQLGLIDGVKSLEDVLAEAVSAGVAPSRTAAAAAGRQEGFEMAKDSPAGAPAVGEQSAAGVQQPVAGQQAVVVEQPKAPAVQAASIEEIEAACPGAPSDFVLAQAKQKLTIGAVVQNFVALQQQQIAQLQQSAAAAVQSSAVDQIVGTAPAGSNGLSQAPASGKQSVDIIDEFETAVEEQVRAGLQRSAAFRAVVAQDTGRHQQYVQALRSITPEQVARRRARSVSRVAAEDVG